MYGDVELLLPDGSSAYGQASAREANQRSSGDGAAGREDGVCVLRQGAGGGEEVRQLRAVRPEEPADHALLQRGLPGVARAGGGRGYDRGEDCAAQHGAKVITPAWTTRSPSCFARSHRERRPAHAHPEGWC